MATQKNLSKRPDAHCVARCLCVRAAEPTNGITLSPASSPEAALPAGHPATSPSPHPLRLRRGWGLSSWRPFARVNPRNAFVRGLLCSAALRLPWGATRRTVPSCYLQRTCALAMAFGSFFRLGGSLFTCTDDSLPLLERFLNFRSSSHPVSFPSLLFAFTCTKFVLLASSSPCLLTSCGSGHGILYGCPL